MRHSRINFVLLSVVTLLVAACAQKSPQEKVAALRAKYSATVNQSGFAAKARMPEPVSEEIGTDEAGTEDTGAEGAGAEDAAELSEGEVLEPPDLGPLRYDILLDIVVATTSREILPELTVDVVHLSSAKQEKQRWQVTLDTSKVLRGPGAQITHALENVEYVEGDVFFTEVRNPVPQAEVAKYPELANAH